MFRGRNPIQADGAEKLLSKYWHFYGHVKRTSLPPQGGPPRGFFIFPTGFWTHLGLGGLFLTPFLGWAVLPRPLLGACMLAFVWER